MMEPTKAGLEPYLGDKKAILIKQTARGCFQECLGCEAKSEYKISNMDFGYMESKGILKEGAMTQPDEMYALEQSSFCMRCCWRDGRSMHISVSSGGEAGGTSIIDYEKPCGCPLQCSGWLPLGDEGVEFTIPCCCFMPELNTKIDGVDIKSKYVCDAYCCISKFAYYEDNQQVYTVKPDSCCFGCCPTCKCAGRRPMIPYFFYDMDGNRITDGSNDDEGQPQIRKVWAGLAKECCSTADTFALFFPDGIDTKRKAGLLGMTFLLDFVVFERQGGNVA